MTTTTIEQLRKADWDRLQRDVATRINLLRATVNRIDSDDAGNAIARDLILPNITLLAEFCENVDINSGTSGGGA